MIKFFPALFFIFSINLIDFYNSAQADGPSAAAQTIQRVYRGYQYRQEEKAFIKAQTVLARAALEVRNRELSMGTEVKILNELTRELAVRKTIFRAKQLLSEDHSKGNPFLNCFDRYQALLWGSQCDQRLMELMTDFLFVRGGEEVPRLKQTNSVAVRFLKSNPDVVLGHGTCFQKFTLMVENGKLGFLVHESPGIQMLMEQEPGSGLNLQRALEGSNFLISNGHLRGHYPFYTEFYESYDQAMNVEHSYGRLDIHGQVRILIKPSVLKRLDYHLTPAHRGAEFVQRTDSFASFTPFELEEFYRKNALSSDKTNEVIFRNPIQFSDVEAVLVEPDLVSETKILLKERGYPEIEVKTLPYTYVSLGDQADLLPNKKANAMRDAILAAGATFEPEPQVTLGKEKLKRVDCKLNRDKYGIEPRVDDMARFIRAFSEKMDSTADLSGSGRSPK